MLKSDSPAIDAGTDVSSFGVTTDLDGSHRPYGSRFDIGAYEYSGMVQIEDSSDVVPRKYYSLSKLS